MKKMERQVFLEPEEPSSRGGHRVFQIIGAVISLVLAGPVLAAVIPIVTTFLCLAGCTVFIVASVPFAAGDIREIRATGTAQ